MMDSRYNSFSKNESNLSPRRPTNYNYYNPKNTDSYAVKNLGVRYPTPRDS
jgi:hypothetical protein